MKPLVYYDFKEINDGEVSISKKRLEEILEEVYQTGYTDGNNSKSYITTTPWTTTPNVTYRGDTAYCSSTQQQPREIASTSPMKRPDYTITCSNKNTDYIGGEHMTFNDIYNQFTKSTKENFPVDVCTKQSERESDVFNSNIPYLCLVIDRRFDDYWNLIILYPYICKESETVTTFGWTDKNGNIYGNIENSTQLWDEFVVGFSEYTESISYRKLWNEFIKKIDKQYTDESNTVGEN